MSSSVLKQIRAREYNFDQIETLLEQRRHVIKIIRDTEYLSGGSTLKSSERPSSQSQLPSRNVIASVGSTMAPAVQQTLASILPMAPAGTPTNTPSESKATTPTKSQAKAAKKQSCNFQVCHACRPFFQDRLPMSFDPVLNNEIPALTGEEMSKLKLLDPGIVRDIGLRHSPRSQFALYSQGDHQVHPGDGSGDDISEDWTPTTTTGSSAESQLYGSFDPFPCPGAGVCPVYSEADGCAYDHGFDDGQRALTHGFNSEQDSDHSGVSYSRLRHVRGSLRSTPGSTSSSGSSVSLPDPMIVPLTPTTSAESSLSYTLASGLGKTAKAATVCGVMSDDKKTPYGLGRYRISSKDSNSSLGSEIEVEGGVALTEEAVGSGMPDIADEKR